MVGWGLCLVLVAMAAVPFAMEASRRPMNAAQQRRAPGRFARLSQGKTHYQWTGPETGPIVVCVHGLTTPSFVWQGLAPGLAQAGYRVLSYDLFGRGYSDRPSGAQTHDFFLGQLEDLLDDQAVTAEIALIGYSMGSVIAGAFAARSRHPVSHVVLLAPAGMGTVGTGIIRRVINLPLIGRWLMLTRYPSILRRGLRAEAELPGSVPDISRLQEAELDYRGFLPAVHSSLRHMLTGTVQADHEKLYGSGIPVLAIWGGTDDVIPLSAKERLTAWNPDAIHHVIDEAGHGLTYTHTPEVLEQVLAFFAKRS